MAEQKSLVSKIPSMIPGAILLLIITIISINGAAYIGPKEVFGIPKFFERVVHLNYILWCILIGMAIRNTVGIPSWAREGVNLSRLFLKTGIVLLGSLYTFEILAKLGGIAAGLIVFFVFFSVFMVMGLGGLLGIGRSMTGVLGAACGICGVSASIATAPTVRAKMSEVGYAIATILSFGVITMFLSPFIGHWLGMNAIQYGAWVGTGILNSGQVLAAALAFDPVVAPGHAVAIGEIWNILRIVFIPVVVFVIAIWYSATLTPEEKEKVGRVSLGTLIKEKFPVFVLGFLAMTVVTSLGVFGPAGVIPGTKASTAMVALRILMTDFFAIGLVGLGMFISIKEISATGGKPFYIGWFTGFVKYVLSLAAIVLLSSVLPTSY